MRNKIVSAAIVLVTFMQLAQGQGNQPLPMDPEVRYGRLPNGLTYYVRHNGEPEKRASFYIIQNAGALLENDSQNGLAHFLEHMAFNGTKNFPGKGIISTLEKHGVAFGNNINAYTSHNETVYNISDVPTENEGLLDTCLLVLNDWSNYLLLTEEEIDAERGVIAEEWRTRRNASFRMMKEYMPVLLRGSKFADRDVIGDLDIINNFDYHTLRDFYHSWYRTDLQAIAVVGDFDAEKMEKKIIELFSAIPPVENRTERPFFEVPHHNETLFVLVTDREATMHSVDMYIKLLTTPADKKGTGYLREQYIRSLFNAMASQRINELVQKGVPPFITGTIRYGGFVRGYDVFSIGASSKENGEEEAFEAIYREAERIRVHGFTEGELQRAKADILTEWETYYKERDKIDNDSRISAMQDHFLTGEPLTSTEFDYEAVKALLPGITVEEVSAKAKEWMTRENRVIIAQGPEAEGLDHITEEEAFEIISKIESSVPEPYIDEESASELVSEILEGSPVTRTVKLELFDAVEWTLGNGVKVVFKKADYEKDEVSLAAYSFGGVSLVDDELIPEAGMIAPLAGSYGAGDFNNIALQKMLSGKKASASVSLAEVTENINGSSTPADFETMLQLLYLRFEKPRFDEEAHNAMMSRYNALVGAMNNNPQKVMQDSLTLILSDYHPRARILNTDFLLDIEFDKIEKLYRERISDADDFTFFIAGNIEEEVAKPLIEKYIGSLTSKPGSEKFKDHGVKQPDGVITREIEMSLAVPKSTVLINYAAETEFNPVNRQTLRVMNGILDMVFTETIREEEGGTYGVSSSVALQQYPSAKATATIMFDCDPDRAAELKGVVYRELDRLITEGPSQEHFSKAVSNVLKNREESKNHNSYWLTTLYTYYFSGINYDDPANFEDILRSLTPADIRNAAADIFEKGDRADLIFKPSQENP
ncbi:MAG: insulinase family protein [Bacteroidales bacterium]|nr:insulinase family protein [Bacteroidales bacterium]